jgi:hypothetical protein
MSFLTTRRELFGKFCLKRDVDDLVQFVFIVWFFVWRRSTFNWPSFWWFSKEMGNSQSNKTHFLSKVCYLVGFINNFRKSLRTYHIFSWTSTNTFWWMFRENQKKKNWRGEGEALSFRTDLCNSNETAVGEPQYTIKSAEGSYTNTYQSRKNCVSMEEKPQ